MANLFKDQKTSVFISYDYNQDNHYKNMVIAWDENDRFDFQVYDESVDVSVDSEDAGSIRRVISRRINRSDVFLCLIGKHTHKSESVDWEIEKAVELEKSLAAVKINRSYETPSALLGKGAEWAYSFQFDSIKRAVRKADRQPPSYLDIGVGLGLLWLVSQFLKS